MTPGALSRSCVRMGGMQKTLPIPVMSERDRARFLAKIAPANERGCHLWTASTNTNGYGKFMFKHKRFGTHRIAYTLWNGPIPEGIEIDHVCYVQACCNPQHLRLATNKQNAENRRKARVDNKSGVRGVTQRNRNGLVRWESRVGHNGRRYNLGYFDTVEEAEAAAVAGRLALFTHNDLDRLPLPAPTQLR